MAQKFTVGQVNEEGKNVDLYIPRKCSATNALIGASDKASVQLNVGDLDGNGVYLNTSQTIAFCGKVRERGQADEAMNRLMLSMNIMKDIKA
eukprot:NODE_11380_length_410_cov_36.113573_g10250_i0.p3 GENE.NODE_11380_length_410_cov_36.113573_g10250_i0~~NODE_11380_length_410_cov_36.113573_g10250_i0.p3  ORF type:complete len:92 (-),score=44.02 NODE_11380_length_410_cov_36.113573_g10250_i0:51-326(-)